jgi:glycosyltransferase involved in cell wall biosynthesis
MGLSLRWTLDSIAAQRRMPDEVCVVFDGEDPIGEKLAREHVAVTEVIVRKECSGGAAQPRNDGWKRIGGRVDYIHFLDSDDLVSPWFYERLSQSLSDDPSLSGVRVEKFSMLEQEIEDGQGFSAWERFDEIALGQVSEENFNDVHPAPFSFVLLRSDAVSKLEIGGQPWRGRRASSPDGKQEYMEDIEFVFRLLASGKLATLGGTGGIYSIRAGSISDSVALTHLWVWRAFELAIVPWADENGDAQARRIAREWRSMCVRKYARSERSVFLAIKVLLRDCLRRPRIKTIVALVLILIGLDPKRRRSLVQRRSYLQADK